jgi:hypothetical protein
MRGSVDRRSVIEQIAAIVNQETKRKQRGRDERHGRATPLIGVGSTKPYVRRPDLAERTKAPAPHTQ